MKHIRSIASGQVLYWHDVHKLLTGLNRETLRTIGLEVVYVLPTEPGSKMLLENGVDLCIMEDGERRVFIDGRLLATAGETGVSMFTLMSYGAYILPTYVAKWLLEGAK